MWEHAYYLQYLNDKGSYAKKIWTVINWKKAEERFGSGVDVVFGSLAGLRSNM
jgi:Fe-Mn family superoxide dismutase